MAGLLNIDFQDPEQAGLLALAQGLFAAGAPQTRRVGIGEALTSGLVGMSQAKNQAEMLKRKKAEQDLAMQMQQMQLGQMQGQMQDQESARQRAAMMPEIIRKFGNDYQGMIRAGIPADFVKSLAESQNYGKSKVARVEDIGGTKGEKLRQMFDEYGNPVGEAMTGYVAPQLVNQGNKQSFVTPQAGQSFPMGMSPEAMDASRRGWAGLEVQRQQLSKPTFSAELGGYVSPQQGFMPIPGIPKKSEKMTEDQAKATGWLVQAENAWKNMQSAGLQGKDAQGNYIVKEAAKPGFNDALAAVPSFGLTGGIANTLRSADRQKFIQSASSLSESLLRAATGAGVNKDEAAQKIAELTPQIGDSDPVIQQKMNAIPLYIESLKVRSGAGAGQAEGIFKKSAPKSSGWSIQKVD